MPVVVVVGLGAWLGVRATRSNGTSAVVLADLDQPLPGSATASTSSAQPNRFGAGSYPGAGGGPGGQFGGTRTARRRLTACGPKLGGSSHSEPRGL